MNQRHPIDVPEEARSRRDAVAGAPGDAPRGTDPDRPDPAGEFTTLDGEAYYRIHAVDALPPFLMNLPTDTDLWMFLSSTGGLTAGRRDPDGALFPYETVDRLYDSPHHTGPVTLVRAQRGGRRFLWEPWSAADVAGGTTGRSLAKNTLGNRVVFEEIHAEAQLAFRYRWAGSDETGWVRTATLTNLGREPVTLTLLDGLRNVLPAGAPLRLHQQSSCLVDAYKRVDLDPDTGLGIFSLTARISDRPEPAEELRASTVWCHGLPGFRVALSADAVRGFRRGDPVPGESVLTGRRGNYFVTSTLTLEPGARAQWHVAADASRSHVDIGRLRARLLQPGGVGPWVEASLREAGESLRRIVGSADGIQLTGRTVDSVHHFANVLFNNLRGGVFVDGYTCPKADFADFLQVRNREVAARHAGFVAALPAGPSTSDLLRAAAKTGDSDLRRLCHEYLPLYFGRRHGDPSRPWNLFSIRVRNADGGQALRYEGNWRDVFQNWEALTLSFPGFIPGVIAKFVNASTVDGFNPYRITRDGVDWEVHDPADPWGGIGYWGDHQIVYLLKFLESMPRHFPDALEEMLGQEIFSYANVPYRIKPHAEMVVDPRSTIDFDDARAALIAARVAAIGNDGKLVLAADGAVYHASLLEKLVVAALAKLSAFVPDGGIWMNTERPEWNDANNALAGSGLSVVTLFHLRRYLLCLEELVERASPSSYPLAVEVVTWLRQVAGIFERHRAMLGHERADDTSRRRMMDDLGAAASEYRARAYDHGFSARAVVGSAEVLAWCRNSRDHVEHSLRANRRADGLYHSYNLVEFTADRAAVRHLAEMLEGQVAALSSGLVDSRGALDLLAALFASRLYRRDQNSFLLYPEKTLPTFLERNRIPEAKADAVPIVGELLAAGDNSILERDAGGVLRFHGDFSNARDVAAALDTLQRNAAWTRSVVRDRHALVELFVDVFEHRTFTGRSGTMYAYEGLGCIYWHMVSKLLLAVQESAVRAYGHGGEHEFREGLAAAYYRIRGGLGFEKTVREYGAFPADPYSHTPAHAGAQQPGMTGHVKEEILARFGELGVRVEDGIVAFDPVLLRRCEFLEEPGLLRYFDFAGAPRTLEVPAGAFAFTYCQVPVVYVLTPGEAWVRVTAAGEVTTRRPGPRLDAGESQALIGRQGTLSRIEVGIPERALFGG